MATREKRNSVKQVGKEQDRKTEVPEGKKENRKQNTGSGRKFNGKPRVRKVTEIEETAKGRSSPDIKTTRTRSASLPPVPQETNSPKTQKKVKSCKDRQQNGVTNHKSRCRTRSDNPVQILRSGKQLKASRIKFEECKTPLEYIKRKRVQNIKEKTNEEGALVLSDKVNSPSCDTGSDMSVCDSPVPEIGKLICDSESEIKMPGVCPDVNVEESYLHESNSEGDQSEATSHTNLGKTISHKISALIKRGRVSEILQKISKAREERRTQGDTSDLPENQTDIKKVKDTNSNFCQTSADDNKETMPVEEGISEVKSLKVDSAESNESDTSDRKTSYDTFPPSVFYKRDAQKVEKLENKEDVANCVGLSSNVGKHQDDCDETNLQASTPNVLEGIKQELVSSNNFDPLDPLLVGIKQEIISESFDRALECSEQSVTDENIHDSLTVSASKTDNNIEEFQKEITNRIDEGDENISPDKLNDSVSEREEPKNIAPNLQEGFHSDELKCTQNGGQGKEQSLNVPNNLTGEACEVPNSCTNVCKSETIQTAKSNEKSEEIFLQVRRSSRTSAHKCSLALKSSCKRPFKSSPKEEVASPNVTDDEASNSGSTSDVGNKELSSKDKRNWRKSIKKEKDEKEKLANIVNVKKELIEDESPSNALALPLESTPANPPELPSAQVLTPKISEDGVTDNCAEQSSPEICEDAGLPNAPNLAESDLQISKINDGDIKENITDEKEEEDADEVNGIVSVSPTIVLNDDKNNVCLEYDQSGEEKSITEATDLNVEESNLCSAEDKIQLLVKTEGERTSDTSQNSWEDGGAEEVAIDKTNQQTESNTDPSISIERETTAEADHLEDIQPKADNSEIQSPLVSNQDTLNTCKLSSEYCLANKSAGSEVDAKDEENYKLPTLTNHTSKSALSEESTCENASSCTDNVFEVSEVESDCQNKIPASFSRKRKASQEFIENANNKTRKIECFDLLDGKDASATICKEESNVIEAVSQDCSGTNSLKNDSVPEKDIKCLNDEKVGCKETDEVCEVTSETRESDAGDILSALNNQMKNAADALLLDSACIAETNSTSDCRDELQTKPDMNLHGFAEKTNDDYDDDRLIIDVIDSEDSSNEMESQLSEKDSYQADNLKLESGRKVCSKDTQDTSDSGDLSQDGSSQDELMKNLTEEYEMIDKDEDDEIIVDVDDTMHSKPAGGKLGAGLGSTMQAGKSAEPVEIISEVSTEDQSVKEPFLSALGLGPRSKVAEPRDSTYTGTLKTVIKVHRSPEKRGSKGSFKFMVKNASVDSACLDAGDMDSEQDSQERVEYSIQREGPAALDPTTELTNFGLGNHLSTNSPFLKENLPNAENSGTKEDPKGHGNKPSSDNLVIPEKSSSFSIHPGRLCSDVCSYCFGKFGSLDTPCHIAQLKNVERQQKILTAETHLTADSCLCDACYRHVDRKVNCPSYNSRKRHQRSGSTGSKTACCVSGCAQSAVHQVRRKWILKLRRSISKKVPIDMEKQPLHQPFHLCSHHYYWVDFYMACGLCKRRLSHNHMYPMGPEVHDLNRALVAVAVPVVLAEKMFVCKLCRYFSQLCLKYRDRNPMSSGNRLFCESYRKKILYCNDIELSESERSSSFTGPKNKKRKTKTGADGSEERLRDSADGEEVVGGRALEANEANGSAELYDLTNRAGASTPMIDYSSLAPPPALDTITVGTAATSMSMASAPVPVPVPVPSPALAPAPAHVPASTAKSKAQRPRLRLGPAAAAAAAGLDPSTEIHPVYSPSNESAIDQMAINASFNFYDQCEGGSRKRKGHWETCTATFQFTKDTKKDFVKLQRPYGNHASFFRHLVLLEKYWRAGDLVLAPGASARAASYVSSVRNRVEALEGPLAPQSARTTAPAPVPIIAISPVAPPATTLSPITPAPMPTLQPYVPPALPIVTPSVSVLPLPPVPLPPASTASATQPTQVAVIDLPLRRPTGASGPVTISTIPIPPSVPTPCVTSSSTPPSPTPVFMSVASAQPQRVVNSNRRPMPNIIQLTSDNKGFSMYQALSLQQVKALREHHKQQQKQKQQLQQQKQQQQQQQKQQPTVSSGQTTDFVPLISDVRSLAAGKATQMWDRAEVDLVARTQAQSSPSSTAAAAAPPKVSLTVLPKRPQLHGGRNLVTIAPKPSLIPTATIVTPTGIILSRNPEISVSSVTVPRSDGTAPC